MRAVVGVLGFGAVLFTAALMLSDRAPGVLRYAFGDSARRLWDRIDARAPGRLGADVDLPEPDFVVHVVVWAVVLVLVALTIWTWRGLIGAVVFVVAGSVLIELAQGRLSTTRSVEFRDVIANTLGVAVGAASTALIFLAWGVVARSVEAVRRRATDGRQQ